MRGDELGLQLSALIVLLMAVMVLTLVLSFIVLTSVSTTSVSTAAAAIPAAGLVAPSAAAILPHLERGHAERRPEIRAGIAFQPSLDDLSPQGGTEPSPHRGPSGRVGLRRTRIHYRLGDMTLEAEHQRRAGDRPGGHIGQPNDQGIRQEASDGCFLAIARHDGYSHGVTVAG